MKSIMLAAQAIKCGDAEIVIAGGMENMSSIPHYMSGRKATKLGTIKVTDGLLVDGLTDVYDQQHMGTCGDLCADEYNFSREDQIVVRYSSLKAKFEALLTRTSRKSLCRQTKGRSDVKKSQSESQSIKGYD